MVNLLSILILPGVHIPFGTTHISLKIFGQEGEAEEGPPEEAVHAPSSRSPSPRRPPASSPPGKAARLPHFSQAWQQVTSNSFILNIVVNGYNINFNSTPVQNNYKS